MMSEKDANLLVDAPPPPPSLSPSPAAASAASAASAPTATLLETDAAAAVAAKRQQARRSLPPPPPLHLPIVDHLRAHRVILASASPRRRALLAQFGLGRLEIWPSTLPEDLSKEEYGPFEYVSATARNKCLHVYQEVLAAQEEAGRAAQSLIDGSKRAPSTDGDQRDPELVIAADTVIISRSGKILEKPRSATEHINMLRHLRDTRVHRVLTAVCVLSPRRDAAHPGYAIAAHTEETKVIFAREVDGLSDDTLDAYVRTREGADKAGGYALQGMGGPLLVERIEGSFDNVIGLPVRHCLRLAEKVIFHQDEEEYTEFSDVENE